MDDGTLDEFVCEHIIRRQAVSVVLRDKPGGTLICPITGNWHWYWSDAPIRETLDMILAAATKYCPPNTPTWNSDLEHSRVRIEIGYRETNPAAITYRIHPLCATLVQARLERTADGYVPQPGMSPKVIKQWTTLTWTRIVPKRYRRGEPGLKSGYVYTVHLKDGTKREIILGRDEQEHALPLLEQSIQWRVEGRGF